MAILEAETVLEAALADRVALVRAQLAPIQSRRALLDSYRRESLCRLAGADRAAGSPADVLEAAYALRWAELELAAPQGDRDEMDIFEPADG